MDQLSNFREVIERYRSFDWQLRKILVSPASREAFSGQQEFGDVQVVESEVDALWFCRPAIGGREAWELRLIAESPYALFETFEPDEPEDEREEVRIEMEARLRSRIAHPDIPPDEH
jgi:hypothetical protein